MRSLTRFSARASGLAAVLAIAAADRRRRVTDPGGRARLRQRQHLAGQHDRRLRPTRRRHAHAGARIAVRDRRRGNRVGDRIPGRAADRAPRSLPARGRRGQRPDLGAQDRARRVAAPGARRRRRLRRIRAGQHRRPRPARLRRQRRRQRASTTRASCSARTAACGRCGIRPSRCRTARSPATCCSTPTARTSRARGSVPSLIDSFRVGRDGRLIAAPGSPFAAQGPGPFGSEFRPTDTRPAVRVERPRRHRQRHRVGLPRRPRRHPDLDRLLAVRRQPDGAVLGRDLARRPVPVHGEHGHAEHLELRGSPTTDRSSLLGSTPFKDPSGLAVRSTLG